MDETNRNYVLDLIDGNHQNTVAKLHRAIIALVIVIVIGLILFFAYAWHTGEMTRKMVAETEQKWIDYLSQYDFTGSEYTQDGNGLNIIGDRNGVNFNEPEVYDALPDTENEE